MGSMTYDQFVEYITQEVESIDRLRYVQRHWSLTHRERVALAEEIVRRQQLAKHTLVLRPKWFGANRWAFEAEYEGKKFHPTPGAEAIFEAELGGYRENQAAESDPRPPSPLGEIRTDRLRLLADWHDAFDKDPMNIATRRQIDGLLYGPTNKEVQQDLRRWADLIEEARGEDRSSTSSDHTSSDVSPFD